MAKKAKAQPKKAKSKPRARKSPMRRGNPIAVSTYSFWHFDDRSVAKMDYCIREAARIGFHRFFL